MKAIVIGPGRIGCGFAGQLLRASGYEVVFVARNPVVVDYFNRVGRYRVWLVCGRKRHEVIVSEVRAVSTANLDQMGDEMSGADLIVTAVGANNLPEVAPLIAAGLRRKSTSVNIIAFENLSDAGPYLRNLVSGYLWANFPLTKHGFSGAIVSRAVTQRLGDAASNELLTFVGDTQNTFIVDGLSLREPLPEIEGMSIVDNYPAWIRRKLYTFSAGHATCAYLGYLKGYHYIHSAILDPEIRAAVLAAMAEGQRGLAARYGSEIAGDEKYLLEILARFDNSALNDSIMRVGRDPKRKLSKEDRLVGAARFAQKAGVRPEKLALAVAAALFFYNPADPSAVDLQREIESAGLSAVLNQVCEIETNQGLGGLVADIWDRLAAGWQKGNLLLSLEEMLWAFQPSCFQTVTS